MKPLPSTATAECVRRGGDGRDVELRATPAIPIPVPAPIAAACRRARRPGDPGRCSAPVRARRRLPRPPARRTCREWLPGRATKNGSTMPSFRPLSTLSPCRTSAGTRGLDMAVFPRAASVGARTAPTSASSQSVSPGSRGHAEQPARPDAQRQSDAEQPTGQKAAGSQIPRADGHGVGEQHQGQGRFEQRKERPGVVLQVDDVEHGRPEENPDSPRTPSPTTPESMPAAASPARRRR